MSTRSIPVRSVRIRAATALLIVVEDVSDLWALERAGAMNAKYHVLGGTLSPLDGVGPDDLNIRGLVDRVARAKSQRSSSPSTPRSRARPPPTTSPTSCQAFDVKITRLAHGVPVGGELDYLDEGTLSAALRSRTSF
jgi:recombination protein RecR